MTIIVDEALSTCFIFPVVELAIALATTIGIPRENKITTTPI